MYLFECVLSNWHTPQFVFVQGSVTWMTWADQDPTFSCCSQLISCVILNKTNFIGVSRSCDSLTFSFKQASCCRRNCMHFHYWGCLSGTLLTTSCYYLSQEVDLATTLQKFNGRLSIFLCVCVCVYFATDRCRLPNTFRKHGEKNAETIRPKSKQAKYDHWHCQQ